MAVYVFNDNKQSWMTLGDSGANIFTGTTDPEAGGMSIQDGDLWWDSNHLELRVYHKPLIPGQNVHWTLGIFY